MIRIVVLLLLLALVAVAAAWMADNPGAVTLTWQGYRVDTSVGILVAAIALIAAATALLYRLWLFVRRVPGSFGRHRHDRRRAKGYRALSAGMVAVAAGDATEARKQARRAEVLLDDPPLTMLLSAQAAQLAGDDQAAAKFFTAMQERPEMAFLGLRGLLNQALHRRDRTEALQLARRAYRLQPKSDWVATSLFDLQVSAGQWQDAEVTLDEAARTRLVDADTARRRRAVLEFMQGETALVADDPKTALARLRKAHDLDPAFVPAAARLAGVLSADGKAKRGWQEIEKTWAKAPHPSLAAAYREARPAADKLQAVKFAEALAAANPDHPESHIVTAEAALDAGLWGEARRHLLAAGGDDPSARICRLLARLEEEEHGDTDTARSWLVRASLADPDPAWCCSSCGHVTAVWTAICGNCDSFDSFEWRTPAHAATLTGQAPPVALPVRADIEATPVTATAEAAAARPA